MESLRELISDFMDLNGTHCNEGSRGIENLCKIVRAIGYRDSMNRMQFRGACIGDLLEFFEDNSGAIDAVISWIEEHDNEEWRANIESELPVKRNRLKMKSNIPPLT